jgi:hypothetical protein
MRLRVYDICFDNAHFTRDDDSGIIHCREQSVRIGQVSVKRILQPPQHAKTKKPIFLAANSSHRGRAGEPTKSHNPLYLLTYQLRVQNVGTTNYNATSWGKTWAVVYQNGGRTPIPRLYLHNRNSFSLGGSELGPRTRAIQSRGGAACIFFQSAQPY